MISGPACRKAGGKRLRLPRRTIPCRCTSKPFNYSGRPGTAIHREKPANPITLYVYGARMAPSRCTRTTGDRTATSACIHPHPDSVERRGETLTIGKRKALFPHARATHVRDRIGFENQADWFFIKPRAVASNVIVEQRSRFGCNDSAIEAPLRVCYRSLRWKRQIALVHADSKFTTVLFHGSAFRSAGYRTVRTRARKSGPDVAPAGRTE